MPQWCTVVHRFDDMSAKSQLSKRSDRRVPTRASVVRTVLLKTPQKNFRGFFSWEEIGFDVVYAVCMRRSAIRCSSRCPSSTKIFDWSRNSFACEILGLIMV